MTIASIGVGRGLQLAEPVCTGSDGIGRRKIYNADLYVQIGLFAYAWPISSGLKCVCLRILLSFEHRDRTEFQRAIANR